MKHSKFFKFFVHLVLNVNINAKINIKIIQYCNNTNISVSFVDKIIL